MVGVDAAILQQMPEIPDFLFPLDFPDKNEKLPVYLANPRAGINGEPTYVVRVFFWQGKHFLSPPVIGCLRTRQIRGHFLRRSSLHEGGRKSVFQ